MITGKGYFIWQISRTEGGNISAIANLASQSGFSHVLPKIADGRLEKFKDEAIAGHVLLVKGERSPLAELAANIL